MKGAQSPRATKGTTAENISNLEGNAADYAQMINGYSGPGRLRLDPALIVIGIDNKARFVVNEGNAVAADGTSALTFAIDYNTGSFAESQVMIESRAQQAGNYGLKVVDADDNEYEFATDCVTLEDYNNAHGRLSLEYEW